jgi:hypothetical protein
MGRMWRTVPSDQISCILHILLLLTCALRTLSTSIRACCKEHIVDDILRPTAARSMSTQQRKKCVFSAISCEKLNLWQRLQHDARASAHSPVLHQPLASGTNFTAELPVQHVQFKDPALRVAAWPHGRNA